MQLLGELRQAVLDLKMDEVDRLTRTAHKEGASPEQIIEEALIEGIRKVGDLFADGKYFLPELLVAGQAVQAAIAYLEPYVVNAEQTSSGKFLIGTVKGDIHDIGKNIVTMMLKCNGWQVEDAGVDVDSDTFCRMVAEGDYDIVGFSALLTMTMPALKETVAALNEAGLRDKTRVMIGGAPLTQEFADEIGADAFGRDAWDTVNKAAELLDGNRSAQPTGG